MRGPHKSPITGFALAPDAPLVVSVRFAVAPVLSRDQTIPNQSGPRARSSSGHGVNVCAACGLDFASVGAFDVHRRGVHEYTFSEGLQMDPPREDGRRCLDREEMQKAGWKVDRRGRWIHPREARRARSVAMTMTGTEISVKGAPTPVDALRDPKWTERQVTIRPPQEIRATVWDRIPLAKRRLLLEGPLSSGHAGLQSAVITLASEFGPREARRARVPDDDGTRTGSPATRCARSTPPGKRRG